jgi:hypothetical protein
VDAMMSPRLDASTNTFQDANASLLAVEFGDIPFAVHRAFVVTREGEKVTRGNHFAGGFQKIILLTGEVDVHLKKEDGAIRDFHCVNVGDSILVEPDDYITYELLTSGSQILVLADQTYAQSLEARKSQN